MRAVPGSLVGALLLAGCPDGGFGEGFVRSDDDDTVGGAGDDDDATGELDDDDDAVPLETGGSFGLWCYRYPDADWEVVSRCRFDGSFWHLLDEGTPGNQTGGVSIAAPAGIDACALTVWDEEDTVVQGDPGEPARYDSVSAGTITLSNGAAWSIDLEPAVGDAYSFELDGDHPPAYDASYDVVAAGEEFPAFGAAVYVPGALVLESPATDERFELTDGDLVVEWGGGTQEQLLLEIHNVDPLTTGNAQITCNVANDGAFTVPGAMVAQLPPTPIQLVLHQPWNGSVDVGEVTVGIGSTATAEARGDGPP